MGRTRQAVETTINGDLDTGDPSHSATKRGLLTLSDHTDEIVQKLSAINRNVVVLGTGIFVALVSATITQIMT